MSQLAETPTLAGRVRQLAKNDQLSTSLIESLVAAMFIAQPALDSVIRAIGVLG